MQYLSTSEFKVCYLSTSGVMVHELSHAYHHRMLPDGYDNKEVKDCYEAAMKEGLYDLVRVHGVQGPTSKAYAASNCMEYFVDLISWVLFLGQLCLNF